MKFFHLILFCLLIIVNTAIASTEPLFKVGTFEHPEISVINTLIKKSYADIGIETQFVTTPLARTIMELEVGRTDAVVVANGYHAANSNNITKVSVPIFQSTVYLYCTKNVICEKSVLDDQNVVLLMNVGTISALKLLNLNISAKIYEVENFKRQLLLLEKGRIDYLVWPSGKGLDMQNKNFNKIKLLQYPIFHLINSKHKHIIDKLEHSIRHNIDVKK